MRPNDLSILVHVVGFLTGAFLYAMLGVMALRGRPAGRLGAGGARLRGAGGDRMALATAALGTTWNVGGLLTYGVRDLGLATPSVWAIALSFAALGFLPAVVVHAAARNLPRRMGGRHLVAAAYGLSAAAAAMQFEAADVAHAAPNRSALLLLSVGYVVLTAALAVLTRRQPRWRRGLSAVALAAFAIMALHLRQHGPATDAWWVEIVGHHASIPLALAILYQDYRFALADVFLKRALALLALLLLALAGYVGLAVPFALPRLAADPLDSRGAAMLVALWLAIAVSYPALRLGVGRFVDRVVLRRADYGRVRAELAAAVATLDREEEVLEATCRLLGPALWARHISWSATREYAPGREPVRVLTREGRQEATIRVTTADSPSYVLELTGLGGGRVLLSDDVRMLEAAATIAVQRIDAVRLTRERVERGMREREILQLATEAELRALRAQLNPHFLFNALTTIGYLMRAAPDRALDTLYRLTELLRAVLRRSDGAFVTLAQELEIVDAYLAIERARFEERLHVTLDVPAELASVSVPPLILQPLVENAVKHGIAPRTGGGSIVVAARREPGGTGAADVLRLTVVDTGVGATPAELVRRRGAGIGLSSVERRLERHFGAAASLDVRSAPGVGTTVELRLPVPVPELETVP